MTKADFSNGVAFVAGGSGGIGAAIVEAFAGAGSDVVFSYHRNKTAAETVKQAAGKSGRVIEYRQLTLQDNLATAQCLAQARQQYGRIHSVVYAAGPRIPVNFAGQLAFEDWKDTFENDAHACFSLVHGALPLLQEQGGGSICAITTTQATRHLPMSVLSSAPKAAVESMLQVVARENGRYGIRANSIRSGWLKGGQLEDGMEGQLEDKMLEQIARQVPLGTLGRPADVADAVVFLASDKARYINGVNLAVDGGWCL